MTIVYGEKFLADLFSATTYNQLGKAITYRFENEAYYFYQEGDVLDFIVSFEDMDTRFVFQRHFINPLDLDNIVKLLAKRFPEFYFEIN